MKINKYTTLEEIRENGEAAYLILKTLGLSESVLRSAMSNGRSQTVFDFVEDWAIFLQKPYAKLTSNLSQLDL